MTPALWWAVLWAVAPVPVGGRAVVERVALPGEAVSVSVSPLEQEVEVRLRGGAGRRRFRSQLCPEVEQVGGRLTFRCRTNRLEARLERAGSRVYLMLSQLRGFPVAASDDRLPMAQFPLRDLGMEQDCQVATGAFWAECALQSGNFEAARRRFVVEVEGPDRTHALTRLGDLALRAGRLDEALRQYELAQRDGGRWSRLAAIRACELSATCLTAPSTVMDASGLPRSMEADLELRAARLLTYLGAYEQALARVARQELACRDAPAFCQRLLLTALQRGAPSVVESAVRVYLEGGHRGWAPLRLELARTVAGHARGWGAPRFAASLLSAETPVVPPAELWEHLAQVRAGFRQAGDAARAERIDEYAATRFPGRPLPSPVAEPSPEERLASVLKEARAAQALAQRLLSTPKDAKEAPTQ